MLSHHQTSAFRLMASIICITAFGITIPPVAHASDMVTQTAQSQGDASANSHDLVQGEHVEGHIAFLKAELAITPDQEPLWEPVATAMREDVRNLKATERATQKEGPLNATEYLENRVQFANLRAQGEARFLNAFRPLYSKLSPQQKRAADDIMIPNPAE